MEQKQKELIQKCVLPHHKSLYRIELPSKRREWMDQTNYHAYKCLPLNVANGFGWEILNPIKFDATWNGDIGHGGDTITFNFHPQSIEEERLVKDNEISSHFGNGIITFSALNFILRTSKRTNIFIKGPTNFFKPNAQALEAIIEADWLPYTFTLNWKIIKPNETVFFERNEPIANFFPVSRGYIESFDAEEMRIQESDELYIEHRKWVDRRVAARELSSQQHNQYMRGIQDIDQNKPFDEHQKFIQGCPFKKRNNGDA